MKINLNVIKQLMAVANDLDRKGLYKEADIVDQILIKSAQATATATAPAAPATTRSLLRFGSRGPQVSDLQQKLNQIQSAGLEVDGIFGTATKNAVMAFQASKGLKQDGVVGPATYFALDSATATPAPAAPTTPTTPTTTTIPATMPAARQYGRDIRYQARQTGQAVREDVRAIQQAQRAQQAAAAGKAGKAERLTQKSERTKQKAEESRARAAEGRPQRRGPFRRR